MEGGRRVEGAVVVVVVAATAVVAPRPGLRPMCRRACVVPRSLVAAGLFL